MVSSKNETVEFLGTGLTYEIKESDVGGYLGFGVAFVDNDGFSEILGPYYYPDLIQQNNVNNFPEFLSTPLISAAEDQFYSYQINTFDQDGDNTFISAISIPDWLNLNDDGNGGITLRNTI